MQILKAYGIDTTYAFRASLTDKPPELPAIHVSRSQVFTPLQQALNQYSVIAVTSYPQSGKSVAIAEFVNSQDCKVLWFNVPAQKGDSRSNYKILCLQLCEHLQLQSFEHRALLNRLNAPADRPSLLVIDNAQWWGDLGELTDLRTIAEASGGAFQMLLVSSDAPRIRQELNLENLYEFRLPGMAVDEAIELFARWQGSPLNAYQEAAVRLLVDSTDGHIGLLRLFLRAVGSLSSDSELEIFKADVIPGLGATAGNRKAGLFNRFKQELSLQQLELCKRLAVLFRPFRERVAQRVWAVGQAPEAFFEVWSSCRIAAFEAVGQTRYLLPELYREGLQKTTSTEAQKRWHAAIADALAEPVEGVVDAHDILHSVIHRVLAGEYEDALRHAAFVLMQAHGTASDPILRLLVSRLHPWLKEFAVSNDIGQDARAIWHSIYAQACRHLGMEEDSTASVLELKTLLSSGQRSAISEIVLSLCYITIATCGLEKGDLSEVETAVASLRSLSIPDAELMSEIEFFVLGAHVTSISNPVPWLRKWLRTRRSSDLLWSSSRGFVFWQGVAACIYKCIEREGRAASGQLLVDASWLVQELTQAGELNVATLIGASVGRLLIDIERNPEKAHEFAMAKLAELRREELDTDVGASLELLLGDTNRCCGKLAAAASHYQSAAVKWRDESGFQRAETSSLLGIVAAKMKHFREARQYFRESAKHFQLLGERVFAARSYLEAAGVCALSGNYPGSLRELLAALPLVNSQTAECAEWVLLGQIAMFIEARDDVVIQQQVVPGFTMAIQGPNPLAAKMLPQGPLVMLARACLEFGRRNRSAFYFRKLIAEVPAPNRASMAALALTNSVLATDLVEFSVLSALATEAGELSDLQPERALLHHQFLFDYVIGNVLFRLVEDDDIGLAESAFRAVEQLGIRNDAVQLLLQAAKAIVDFERSADLTGIDTAFEFAIKCDAYAVARHLSWFWLFRSIRNRPIYVNELIRWAARFASMSLIIGSHDGVYIDRTCRQLGSLFRACNVGAAGCDIALADLLESHALSPEERLTEVLPTALESLAETDDASRFVWELHVAVRSTRIERFSSAIEKYCLRLVRMLLIPAALEFQPMLRSYVDAVRAEWQESALRQGADADKCRSLLDKVASFATFVECGSALPEQLELLLHWGSDLPKACPPSAGASYYILLRHLLTTVPGNSPLRKAVSEALRSEHAQSLAVDLTVPQNLRTRLNICIRSARAHDVYKRLILADALGRPLGELKAELKTETSSLREIADSADSQSEAGRFDRFAAAFEAGEASRRIGKAFEDRDASWANSCFSEAMTFFETALSCASASEWARKDPALLIRAAVHGLQTARELDDAQSISVFQKVLSDLNQSEELGEIIIRETKLAAGGANGVSTMPTSDSELDEFLSSMMREHSIPAEFKAELQAEGKLLIIALRERQKFCRFLKPERFPGPIATYSASCEHFGHRLSVEQLNPESAIDGFKQVYCGLCSVKSPLAGTN